MSEPGRPGQLRRATDWLDTQPNSVVTVLAWGSVLLVGVVDFAVGSEVTLSLFYLLPVWLVAWHIGQIPALVIAVAAAATSLVSNLLTDGYTHPAVPYWNAGVRLAVLLIVAFLLSALRESLNRESVLARTDALTGIRNARSFYESIELELGRSRRYGAPLTIVYMDVDDFKAVNDGRGHGEGDRLLQLIGHALRSSLRRVDLVARLGGDEFAILLPETGPEPARVVLRKLSGNLTAALKDGPWPTTFSIGAITLVDYPGTAEECIEKVDEMMYAVKITGKNGIKHEVLGDPPVQERA